MSNGAGGRTEAERIAKLETEHQILRRDVTEIKTDLTQLVEEGRQFRQEWRSNKERETAERAEHARAKQLTVPQIVQMIASAVAVTAIILGGGMWVVRNEAASVRLENSGQNAQFALQIRGQQDNITAAQTGLQSLQRDMGAMSVDVGLVKQSAKQNSEFIRTMSAYDAQMAKQEQRTQNLEEWVRSLARRLEAQKPPT